MKTLKALGLLLTYPEKELVSAWPDILKLLKEESWLSDKTMSQIENLSAWMTMTDILDLQEAYVDLFDRTPSLSLHLFEHVHGDSNERGQAMVDLAEIYKEKGFNMVGEEMPDYLPLFLEYLSTEPVESARKDLGDVVDILAVIGGRLEKRASKYAVIFAALEEASQRKPNLKAVEKALKEASGAPVTKEELDAIWEEQGAFENQSQESNDCPKVGGMISQLKEMETEPVKETGS